MLECFVWLCAGTQMHLPPQQKIEQTRSTGLDFDMRSAIAHLPPLIQRQELRCLV